MDKFLKIFEAIFGVGVKVLPIFIHNPQSQQTEAIIVTSAETAFTLLEAIQQVQNKK